MTHSRPFILLVTTLLFAGFLGATGCGVEPGSQTLAEGDVDWIRFSGSSELAGGGSSPHKGVEFKTFTLIGKKGGTFSFRKISVRFPPKAVNGRYEVRITQPDPKVAIWDLHIESSIEFSKPVTITIDYAGMSDAESHVIVWYDEDTKVWVNLGGTDDKGNQNIKVDVGHFSRYGLCNGTSSWGDGTSGWD